MPCRIDDCPKPVSRPGAQLCEAHYTRIRVHGSPHVNLRDRTAVDRFWAMVGKSATCWWWLGAKNPAGYGQFFDICKPPLRCVRAHRFAYEQLRGPIPAGLVIDHLCRNPACVNPEHMETVTIGENVLRGDGIAAQHARKTTCKHGHPLSGDNLKMEATPNGRSTRRCLTCRRQNEKRRRKVTHGASCRRFQCCSPRRRRR